MQDAIAGAAGRDYLWDRSGLLVATSTFRAALHRSSRSRLTLPPRAWPRGDGGLANRCVHAAFRV